jgi:plasmid stabilization system protein ParE
MWSPAARLDLRNLYAYIAEHDSRAARRFIQSIFRSVERLIEFPQSGRMVPEFADPKLREIIKRPCRIVYRIKSKQNLLEIVRVWHAARGAPEL